ncbi:MAG: hypothetical protein WDN45_04525 [Caulobacteraceae bacterium]
MTLPGPEGRPVWEPVVIALFLALVIAWDLNDVTALFQSRMPPGGQARAALELGVAVMMLWGLLRALLKAATWKPDDAA